MWEKTTFTICSTAQVLECCAILAEERCKCWGNGKWWVQCSCHLYQALWKRISSCKGVEPQKMRDKCWREIELIEELCKAPAIDKTCKNRKNNPAWLQCLIPKKTPKSINSKRDANVLDKSMFDIVELLLPDNPAELSCKGTGRCGKRPLLQYVVQHKFWNVVRFLLKKGVNVGEMGNGGYSALVICTKHCGKGFHLVKVLNLRKWETNAGER